jgi:ribosomal 30S subunit maturation factor RimM
MAQRNVRGLSLAVRVAPGETPDDPEEFHAHQPVGLAVATTDGEPVGGVAAGLYGGGPGPLTGRSAHRARRRTMAC